MTDLEKTRLELQQAQEKKMQAEHQLIRSQNRLRNALKKQDKERTHRLIQEGAELEYIFDGIEKLPVNCFWEFMRKLSEMSEVRRLYEFYRIRSNDECSTEPEAVLKKGGER